MPIYKYTKRGWGAEINGKGGGGQWQRGIGWEGGGGGIELALSFKIWKWRLKVTRCKIK